VFRLSTRELSYASGGHPAAILLGRGSVIPLATEGAPIGCFDTAQFVSAKQIVEPGARLLVFSDGVFEIFLEGDRVQTWQEFASCFDRAEFAAMTPSDHLKHAQRLRGAEILEDDFSLLEVRFP
jgi:sigma-B regulation protein RsbU (phosphoserine phosphatase)